MQKAANVYSDLDFNFDLPSDEEAEESFSEDYSQEPSTPAEAHSPSSSSVPSANVEVPVLISTFLTSTSILFFHVYLLPFVWPEAQVICSLPFNKLFFFFVFLLEYLALPLFFFL